jgi:Holliday junction resolvase RusA-like endonuclease
MTAQVFYLPIPPSVNGLYINVRGRGRVKSARYRAWLKHAGWELQAQKGRMKTILGPVKVAIYAVRPKGQRAPDIDNIQKALLDILVEHKIIEDDRHVVKVSSEWVVSTNLTGVSLCIEQTEMEHDRVPGRLAENKAQAAKREREAGSGAPVDRALGSSYRDADAAYRSRASQDDDPRANYPRLRIRPLAGAGIAGRHEPSDEPRADADASAPREDGKARRGRDRARAPKLEKTREAKRSAAKI